MSALVLTAFVCCVLAIGVHSQNLEDSCVPVGNTAYYVSNVQLTFDNAKKYCENMNARLVTLDSKQKAGTVYNIIKQRDGDDSSSRFYWINAQDVDWNLKKLFQKCGNRNFVWLNNNKCLSRTYTNWCTDEPNREYEKCVDIEEPAGSYCWCDVDCTSEKYFVCERTPKRRGSYEIL